MQIPIRRRAGVVATGIAVVGISAMVVGPLAPLTASQSPPTVARDVRLAAATVPPGGLVTSFLGNQVVYCSIICPLVVQTGVTALGATLQTPGTFLTAAQSGDLLRAIGVTVASVTGPTAAAAGAAILADGSEVAPRALNAFEVGVVGLLNVVPAAAGGLPAIAAAVQIARRDTFAALNLPVVANPTPTVMPQGVLQVAVVGAINVGAAVIFPAFNDVLSGAFEIPDAVAQELAATGDPVRAVAAGVNTAVRVVIAAGTAVADSVVTAVGEIRTAAGQPLAANQMTRMPTSAATTTPARAKVGPPHLATTTTKHANNELGTRHRVATTSAKHANAELGGEHPLRDVASNLRRTARSVVKKASERPHGAESISTR